MTPERKRALLEALLQQRAAELSTPHPLSYGQKALWFLYQRDRQSAAYNTAFTARITGHIDAAAVRDAFQQLTARHAALRTTFSTEGGETVQQVHGHRDVHFERRDVSGVSDEALSQMVADAYRQPFDLERGPVMRVTWLSRSPNEHVLLVAVHHIACDAWSLWIMADELQVLLSSDQRRRGGLAPPARSYTDFVRWQTETLGSARGEELRRYWRGQLEADVPPLLLPTDHVRPPVRNGEGESYFFELPPALVQELRTVATRHGTTLYAVLLAAFQVLLHRYSHQEDFTLGTLTSGRTSPEFAGVVGYFANPVVVRARVSGNTTFSALLSQVREGILGALAHQDCPFPLLIEELRPTPDPSRTPLMDVLFVYQKRQSPTLTAERETELRFARFDIPQMEGQFDLTLEITEGGRAVLKYATDLFERSRIVRMAEHFHVLLRGILANPEARVSSLPLLTQSERDRVITTWNATTADFPTDVCLHELFEVNARRTPEAIAVRCDGRAISYRELNGSANRIARLLRDRGTGPETVVGVCLERSVEMVVALLGVLKAGGAYLPLNPSYPAERLRFMAHTADVRVVLANAALRSTLAPALPECSWLDVDLGALASDHDEQTWHSGVTPANLAYVIYTSGSTGDSKGAMNTHRAICNRLTWMQNAYRLGPADRVLQKTPFSFDVSVWELFWPLLNGATLVMARPGGHQDSAYLVRTIRTEGMTVVHFVPSMLRPFLDEPDVHTCTSLRQIFCSGEALPVELQDRCQARLAAEIHNLYGPTEAAVDVTFWRCERGVPRSTVPIGRPIANTQMLVLDRRLQPVPIGVAGELYIGGESLGRGYVRRPDLTAERFIPNPFSSTPGTRLYRTGDVGRFLADGAIEYLGRVDQQVKVRGVRIEPGEIESALLKHPNVRAVVAAISDAQPGEPRLVAYFVAENNPPPTTTELRRYLSTTLPPNLIPELFEPLDALPLTTSGKIDRKRLPSPRATRPNLDSAFERPRTNTEAIVADVWQRVLGVERVGIHDNFFDLGGHSLRMTQVTNLLDERLGHRVSVVELFQYPTVHALAAYLSGDEPLASRRVDADAPDRAAQRRRIDELRMTRERHRASLEAQDADHV